MSDFLDRQPAWSDMPLIVLTTRRREPTAHWQLIAELSSVRNATLLERPMRTEMLLQAVRVALRSRDRQYQLRASIKERESLLAQREMLLREVHHRVKNNLQMMQSLVRLSAARAPPQAAPLFTDLVGRLGAIGQLHSRIYASGNLTAIDAAAYLADVVDQVDAAFGALQQRVRITKRLEPIMVDVDTAIPLGPDHDRIADQCLSLRLPGRLRRRHRRRVDVAGRHGRAGDRRQRHRAATGVGAPVFNRTAAGPGARQTSWRHVGDKQWTRPVRNGLFPPEAAGHCLSLES